MTVTTNTNKVQALGNGATKTFPYSFRIYSASELEVTSTDLSTGVDTPLVLNTDYTVTGAGSYNGGNVVLSGDAPSASTRITIRRVILVTQATDLRNQGAYFAETHEDVFDKLTMVDQQQQEAIDRSLRLPASSKDVSTVLPLPAANRALKWSADGTALENSDVDPDEQVAQATAQAAIAANKAAESLASASAAADSETAAAASAALLLSTAYSVVSSFSALRALDKTVQSKAHVTGYAAAGDGGSGLYYFDAADTTSADNGKTIIVATDGGRWKLAGQGVFAPGVGTENQTVEHRFHPLRAALHVGGSDTLPQNDEKNYWRGLADKNAWGTAANIGLFSAAFNRNGASYASYSNTFGHDCITYGVASMAGGAGSCTGDPDNPTSPAFEGYCSFAWGKNVLAAGSKSAALCEESLAYGRASLAAGYVCQTAGYGGDDGTGSVALGYQSQAWGNYSAAYGRNVKAYNGQVLIGSGISAVSPMLSGTNNAVGIGAGVVSPQIECVPGSGATTNWGSLIVRGASQDYHGNFGAVLCQVTQTLTNSASGGYGEFHMRPRSAGSLVNGWSVDAGRTGGVVSLMPVTDNATWLGGPANRTAVVYAVSGTINTSDAREKNWIGDLSAAEMRVAVRLSKMIGMYQWTEAVQKKGADARLHIGVKAQDVEAAFSAEGLDGMRYGVLCYDEWQERPEVTNDAGEVTEPARVAGNRYGIRHDQLAMWIAAGFEHRLALAGI